MIQSLYILNKAGGLVYQRDFSAGLAKLPTNDYLMLAGTFHGVHALTTRVSPVAGSSGVTSIETPAHTIHCFQTLSGIKFLVITDSRQYAADIIINRIYQLYADYVLKNPFYQLDMPIRCDQFDRHLVRYIETVA